MQLSLPPADGLIANLASVQAVWQKWYFFKTHVPPPFSSPCTERFLVLISSFDIKPTDKYLFDEDSPFISKMRKNESIIAYNCPIKQH